jgi:hypothetical protein
MSYNSQAALSQDGDFRNRIAACAAVETDNDIQATAWADAHIWEIAAAPGFADAYASALAAEVPRPGADESVITDAMILSAVQAIVAEQAATPTD